MQRARLPRTPLGERDQPRPERAQARGCPLRAGSKRNPPGPRPPLDDPRQQLARTDRRHPVAQRRPPIHVEAQSPRADALPGLAERIPHQPKQAERQADRRCRVVAAGAKPPRQNRRDPAAPPTPVSTHGHGDHLGLAVGARRSPDLSLAYAVSVEAQARAQRLARCAASTAAAGPSLVCRGQILRPFLDRDRRVDDALSARSSLHECRARREAVTTNLRLPSPFCGRHRVDARSMARASTSAAVRGPSLGRCRETSFAPGLVPQIAGARSDPITSAGTRGNSHEANWSST